MKLGEVIGCGAIGTIAFGIISLFCGWGTRGIQNNYTFQYQGKPAVVRRKDVRWGPDQYYFLLNEKDRLTGTLTTDDGKKIKIYDGVRGKDTKYSIRDAPTNQQVGGMLL